MFKLSLKGKFKYIFILNVLGLNSMNFGKSKEKKAHLHI